MSRFTAYIILYSMTFFCLSCDGPRVYSDAEEFLTDFVNVLRDGDERRFLSFYLQDEEFDLDAEGGFLAHKRFSGTIKSQFLKNCNSAMSVLKGKAVYTEKIDLSESNPRVAQFLKNVRASYSNVTVGLKADEQKVNLIIAEIVKVGENWRLTTFITVIDAGTERLEPRAIEFDNQEDQE